MIVKWANQHHLKKFAKHYRRFSYKYLFSAIANRGQYFVWVLYYYFCRN